MNHRLFASITFAAALAACGGIDRPDDALAIDEDPVAAAAIYDGCIASDQEPGHTEPFWLNLGNECALASKYNMDVLLGLHPDATQAGAFASGMASGGHYHPARGTARTRAASDAMAAGQRTLTGKAMRVEAHDFSDPSGWTVDQWLRMGSN